MIQQLAYRWKIVKECFNSMKVKDIILNVIKGMESNISVIKVGVIKGVIRELIFAQWELLYKGR